MSESAGAAAAAAGVRGFQARGRYDDSAAYSASSSGWPKELEVYLSEARAVTLTSDDDALDFYHPECTRSSAELALLTLYRETQKRLFLVRIPVKGARFAVSFVRVGGDGSPEVSHALISRHDGGHHGYCLNLGSGARHYATLQLLTDSLQLDGHVPRSACSCRSKLGDSGEISCSDVIGRLDALLSAGTHVADFHWALARTQYDAARTFVRFGPEEHIARESLVLDADLVQRLLAATHRAHDARGVLAALRLNGCRMGPHMWNLLRNDGVRRLLQALPRGLVLLDLQVNEIDDDTAEELARAIAVHATVRAVDVRHNFITARGAVALQNAMCRNASLCRVDVWPQLCAAPPLNEIVPSTSRSLRAAADAMDEVARVRVQLLSGALELHGFLTHAEADALLQVGQFVTYLHAEHPLAIVVASRKSDGVTRTFVTRSGNAYKATCTPERDLSLLTRASWAVLALAARRLAAERAPTSATQLPFSAVLCVDDDALLRADASWSVLPRQLRALLGRSSLISMLWCPSEPLLLDDVLSEGKRPSSEPTIDALLYRTRQGLMNFLAPTRRESAAPAPAAAAAAAAAAVVLPKKPTGQKSMFKVNL
jgi:hypothetical protein